VREQLTRRHKRMKENKKRRMKNGEEERNRK
jgi:hypothetical protein